MNTSERDYYFREKTIEIPHPFRYKVTTNIPTFREARAGGCKSLRYHDNHIRNILTSIDRLSQPIAECDTVSVFDVSALIPHLFLDDPYEAIARERWFVGNIELNKPVFVHFGTPAILWYHIGNGYNRCISGAYVTKNLRGDFEIAFVHNDSGFRTARDYAVIDLFLTVSAVFPIVVDSKVRLNKTINQLHKHSHALPRPFLGCAIALLFRSLLNVSENKKLDYAINSDEDVNGTLGFDPMSIPNVKNEASDNKIVRVTGNPEDILQPRKQDFSYTSRSRAAHISDLAF